MAPDRQKSTYHCLAGSLSVATFLDVRGFANVGRRSCDSAID